jgi:diguanylate cyclase
VVTRKGGEEFAILLIDCGLTPAINVAERVRMSVERYEFKLSSHNTTNLTVSVGVASIPETAAGEKELIEQADKTLYQAKNNGRNRVYAVQQVAVPTT